MSGVSVTAALATVGAWLVLHHFAAAVTRNPAVRHRARAGIRAGWWLAVAVVIGAASGALDL